MSQSRTHTPTQLWLLCFLDCIKMITNFSHFPCVDGMMEWHRNKMDLFSLGMPADSDAIRIITSGHSSIRRDVVWRINKLNKWNCLRGLRDDCDAIRSSNENWKLSCPFLLRYFPLTKERHLEFHRLLYFSSPFGLHATWLSSMDFYYLDSSYQQTPALRPACM